MLEEVTLWGKKLKDGMQLAHDFHFEHSAQLPKHIKKIAFVGMGGSGIAGHVVKTFLDKKTSIPTFIIDYPEVPKVVDSETLVFTISYSGNTWEVLECVNTLVKNFIPTIALTRGGKLAEIAEKNNMPIVLLPESLSPRSAVGNFLGFIFTLLDLMGILDGKNILGEFVKQADLYIPKFKDQTYFKDFLEKASGSDFFHVWGVRGSSGAFAYRAQTQFNENSKMQATTSYFPELNHNLLNGFAKFTEKPFVLLFATEFLSAALNASIDATTELLKEIGVTLYKPPVLGDTWEGQLFHMILWSDFASCYLAKIRGVEINQVELIERLKKLYQEKSVK
jgi:glucose/mannose-6-phosphate isomerase